MIVVWASFSLTPSERFCFACCFLQVPVNHPKWSELDTAFCSFSFGHSLLRCCSTGHLPQKYFRRQKASQVNHTILGSCAKILNGQCAFWRGGEPYVSAIRGNPHFGLYLVQAYGQTHVPGNAPLPSFCALVKLMLHGTAGVAKNSRSTYSACELIFLACLADWSQQGSVRGRHFNRQHCLPDAHVFITLTTAGVGMENRQTPKTGTRLGCRRKRKHGIRRSKPVPSISKQTSHTVCRRNPAPR